MSTPIIALHGFLGRPSDFLSLSLAPLRAIDIFRTIPSSLPSWAQRFNQHQQQKSILLGYSMGGRAALHCLLDKPELYKAAIIVVAHPGLKDEVLKQQRRYSDALWAAKFAEKKWPALIEEWENTPALKSSVPIFRREEEFDRTSLMLFMRHFSLGTQDYLLPALNELSVPILWLGAQKEALNYQGLCLKHPYSQQISIDGSHRFIFEDPKKVRTIILNFLENLSRAE